MGSCASAGQADRRIQLAGAAGPATVPAARRIRIGAAGDLHCHESNRREIAAALAGLDGRIDVLVPVGDLTTHGEPNQARMLADACRECRFPIFAVL